MLKKLASTNKACRKVMNKFYNEAYEGKKRVLFDFWKIEKETFDLICAYPNKKAVETIIRKVIKNKFVRYPKSEK